MTEGKVSLRGGWNDIIAGSCLLKSVFLSV
jgi:hypothetical protein